MRPYPRPIHTSPQQLDADIRNGTFARKTRAHAEAIDAWVFVRWDGKVTIDMYVESTEVGSYHWVLEAITEAIKLGADMTGVDDPA